MTVAFLAPAAGSSAGISITTLHASPFTASA
jgi:hypothetical protein